MLVLVFRTSRQLMTHGPPLLMNSIPSYFCFLAPSDFNLVRCSTETCYPLRCSSVRFLNLRILLPSVRETGFLCRTLVFLCYLASVLCLGHLFTVINILKSIYVCRYSGICLFVVITYCLKLGNIITVSDYAYCLPISHHYQC